MTYVETFDNLACQLNRQDKANLELLLESHEDTYHNTEVEFYTNLNITEDSIDELSRHQPIYPGVASIGWSTNPDENDNIKSQLSDIGKQFAR